MIFAFANACCASSVSFATYHKKPRLHQLAAFCANKWRQAKYDSIHEKTRLTFGSSSNATMYAC